MDRITSVKSIARNLRDLVVDTTPSSMTGTSIDASKLIHPISGQLKGFDLYIYSGGGAGQQRTITDFLPANNRLTIDDPFSPIPSVNSNFLIFEHFGKDEYDNALDRMIGQARMRYLEEKVATLNLVGTIYEYAVPSGYDYISRLRLVPSGSKDYGEDTEVRNIFELPPRYWRIEPNALGTFCIVFDRRKIDLDDFDNQMVNILGQAKPDISATDNATIPQALEEYIISGASMLLASSRIAENQEWRAKFQIFQSQNTELKEYIHRTRYGVRVGG